MDGNAAPGVRQRLDAWRAQGADRVDPVRFALIESLARRAGAHEGLARRLLDERLSGLVEDYARDVAASAPVDASGTRDPLLSLRGAYEIPFIRRVADALAPRCALVPWLAVAPVGIDGLRQLDG